MVAKVISNICFIAAFSTGFLGMLEASEHRLLVAFLLWVISALLTALAIVCEEDA